MRLRVCIGLIFCAAAASLAANSLRTFEPKPRQIATGRDPILSVRASGALSLLKVEGSNLVLQTSFDGGDSFEKPVRVNDVENEVASHHESSPQMQVRTRSEFYVAWQTRRGNSDGSVLRFARSLNWGETFQKAIDVDPTPGATGQSFFTLNVSPKGVVYVAWLDSRERGKGRPGTAAVYLARSSDKGATFEKPIRVALDACPCCRPSVGFSGKDGLVHVSWRGVLENNVRDVFLATSNDDGRTFAASKRVAEDNWALNGCPHSGAALASIGNRLFLAWHTVREKNSKVYLAYTDNAGESFSPRIDISEKVLDPNHPFLLNTGDHLALVFQGRDASAGDEWAPVDAFYRDVEANGKVSPLERLGHLGASASYPTLAYEEPGRLFAAWTEPKQDEKVIVLSRGRRGATHAVR